MSTAPATAMSAVTGLATSGSARTRSTCRGRPPLDSVPSRAQPSTRCSSGTNEPSGTPTGRRPGHGDDACYADLPRDPAQRRADALWQMAQDAAGAPGSAAADVVHNVVWSSESFEAMLASLATGESPRLDPRTHRCSTVDGIALEPTEAASTVFVARMRRVVTDAAGTVIDLGRARRFTGSARHAVQLQSTSCVWPGCHRPTSQCEVDHLTEHSRRGMTCPGNGAPLCGRHNRWKQRGFSVWRDPTGQWHTARPDGTEIN